MCIYMYIYNYIYIHTHIHTYYIGIHNINCYKAMSREELEVCSKAMSREELSSFCWDSKPQFPECNSLCQEVVV